MMRGAPSQPRGSRCQGPAPPAPPARAAGAAAAHARLAARAHAATATINPTHNMLAFDTQPSPSTSAPATLGEGFPLFIAARKDLLTTSGRLAEKHLRADLVALQRLNGIAGVVVDVYWGIVERDRPRQYDWSGCKHLLRTITGMGFKVKVNLCFNSAPGIPLPKWVHEVGEASPDIWFTDKSGARSKECLSFGVDELPMLQGRTAQEVYYDFMLAFRQEFSGLLGTSISSILIGLGPDGELKYPSHPSGSALQGSPGPGEFQCYDQFLLASLQACAEQAHEPPWGLGGPHDGGHFKEWPLESSRKGGWRSGYGRFFLQWYSEMLIRHATLVMGAARAAFAGAPVTLRARIPSCHWSEPGSHAPELTAGYYNTEERNGYLPVFKALSALNCGLHISLVDAKGMNPEQRACVEAVLQTQRAVAAALHVPVCAEVQELQLDAQGLARMEDVIFAHTISHGIELPPVNEMEISSMCDQMFEPENWEAFSGFVQKVRDRSMQLVKLQQQPVPEYDALTDTTDTSVTSSKMFA